MAGVCFCPLGSAWESHVEKPASLRRLPGLQAGISQYFLQNYLPRNKIKFALRIAPETQQLVKDLCPRDNCQTQNEFIERAIRFYAGYVSGNEAMEYLPPALVSALRATVKASEDRICRLLFKLAVEMDMVMNILAAGIELTEEDLRQLRPRCVREVKETRGRISFEDAWEYQKGAE